MKTLNENIKGIIEKAITHGMRQSNDEMLGNANIFTPDADALTAELIKAVNRQNSEPVYQEFNPIFDAYYDCDKETYDTARKKRIVYLAPQEDKTK